MVLKLIFYKKIFSTTISLELILIYFFPNYFMEPHFSLSTFFIFNSVHFSLIQTSLLLDTFLNTQSRLFKIPLAYTISPPPYCQHYSIFPANILLHLLSVSTGMFLSASNPYFSWKKRKNIKEQNKMLKPIATLGAFFS